MIEAMNDFLELDPEQIRYIDKSCSQTDTRANLIPATPIDEWRNKVMCLGMTKLFFQPEGERPKAKEIRENAAKAVCETCTVRIKLKTFATLR